MSLSMLTGAGLLDVSTSGDVTKTMVHTTFDTIVQKDTSNAYYADLTDVDGTIYISNSMPAYGVLLDDAGGVKQYLMTPLYQKEGELKKLYINDTVAEKDVIRVDCYVEKTSNVKIVNIEPDTFGGYYYIEAETLFRDEATGADYPAVFVLPKAKIQSNFTFTMASSGDPSTFTFTIDAFPGYTKFDKQDGGEMKKVLCAIQITDETTEDTSYHYQTSSSASTKTDAEPIDAPQYPHISNLA